MKYRSTFWLYTFMLLLITWVMIFLSYQYFDKAIAHWIHHHDAANYYLKSLAIIPLFFYFAAPAGLFTAIFLANFIQPNRWLQCAFDSAIATIITYYIVNISRFIFNHYWPHIWKHHKVSLANQQAYGLHFFQFGKAYPSFPSAPTAISFGFLVVIMLYYPRTRLLISLLLLAISASLLSMNYYFLSDIIAGAVIGSVIATMVVKR